jgi:hypothetical protein
MRVSGGDGSGGGGGQQRAESLELGCGLAAERLYGASPRVVRLAGSGARRAAAELLPELLASDPQVRGCHATG